MPLLEFSESSPAALQDHRMELAWLVRQAPCRIAFCFLFRSGGHLNVLEARALVRLVLWAGARGHRRCRLLVGLDSKVLLGAAVKADARVQA